MKYQCYKYWNVIFYKRNISLLLNFLFCYDITSEKKTRTIVSRILLVS